MINIEFYDSKNLQDKILIWNHNDDEYETFYVTNSCPGSETMHVRGYGLFYKRRQFWFNKVDCDIKNLYILKKEYQK